MDRPLDGYVDVNRDRWKGDRPDSSFECGAHKAKAPENQCFRWFPSAGKQKGRPKPPLASRLFLNSLQVRRLPPEETGRPYCSGAASHNPTARLGGGQLFTPLLVAEKRRGAERAGRCVLEKAMPGCRKYCFGRTERGGTHQPQPGDPHEARLFHHADPPPRQGLAAVPARGPRSLSARGR